MTFKKIKGLLLIFLFIGIFPNAALASINYEQTFTSQDNLKEVYALSKKNLFRLIFTPKELVKEAERSAKGRLGLDDITESAKDVSEATDKLEETAIYLDVLLINATEIITDEIPELIENSNVLVNKSSTFISELNNIIKAIRIPLYIILYLIILLIISTIILVVFKIKDCWKRKNK